MTICISNNTITFGDNLFYPDSTLNENSIGYIFTGTICATDFISTSGQGRISGYTSGGVPNSNVIDKFPFASDANATDVGNLIAAEAEAAGQSSTLSGYISGGACIPITCSNVIQKFPFATDSNATDVGDLSQARSGVVGQSSSVNGYTSAGRDNNPTIINTIDKFPFAVDGNATDVGDLTQARTRGAGQSSTTHGYTSGGFEGVTADPSYIGSNVIDKFPFATDANATDVGDFSVTGRRHSAGQSSSTHGYTSGGFQGNPSTGAVENVIDKFPFASDTNATDVGDLTVARRYAAGQSSISNGYTSGGDTGSVSNVIDKFPFASDANATDVGNLTVARCFAAGQQV